MQPRLPSPFAIFAITVAGLFGILTTVRGLVDSDYYWHVTAGRLVAERGVMSTDPFSYTWAGQPWVMHEWLGELLIYWLVSGLGVGITAFVFGVISISGPLVVAWTLRRMGVPMLPLALATGLVVYLYASYATIRPQAISWLFLGILLSGMLTIRPEHRWRPWLTVPLFAVWANVHGLYVIGLGVLGVYVLFTLLGRTPMAPRRWEMLGVLVAAVRRLEPDAGRAGRAALPVALPRGRRLGTPPHLRVAVAELPRSGAARAAGAHRGGPAERHARDTRAGWRSWPRAA